MLVPRRYPDLAKLVKVTLVEAGPNILGTFDSALVEYYASSLAKRGIDIRTGTAVTSVDEEGEGAHHTTSAQLADGTQPGVVWSTRQTWTWCPEVSSRSPRRRSLGLPRC